MPLTKTKETLSYIDELIDIAKKKYKEGDILEAIKNYKEASKKDYEYLDQPRKNIIVIEFGELLLEQGNNTELYELLRANSITYDSFNNNEIKDRQLLRLMAKNYAALAEHEIQPSGKNERAQEWKDRCNSQAKEILQFLLQTSRSIYLYKDYINVLDVGGSSSDYLDLVQNEALDEAQNNEEKSILHGNMSFVKYRREEYKAALREAELGIGLNPMEVTNYFNKALALIKRNKSKDKFAAYGLLEVIYIITRENKASTRIKSLRVKEDDLKNEYNKIKYHYFKLDSKQYIDNKLMEKIFGEIKLIKEPVGEENKNYAQKTLQDLVTKIAPTFDQPVKEIMQKLMFKLLSYRAVKTEFSPSINILDHAVNFELAISSDKEISRNIREKIIQTEKKWIKQMRF